MTALRWEVIDRVIHDTKGAFSTGNVSDLSCPAITVSGGVATHFQVYYHSTDSPPPMPKPDPTKPPYRVPLMTEIVVIPPNGFNAVSTFSGCGGSSTGYRMAGFKVLWASEFIPAAQETYRANMAPHTVLDTRDIREVKPDDILAATGLKVGEIDLFDGSPPCASFSTAGKREEGWGKVKTYSDSKQRTDDLFHEFARLVKGTQPRVFVAENVSGLVKGTAKGYFLEILKALKACGYKVSAKVLDAKWLGVPQSRQRLIFIGVREDLAAEPAHPKPLGYQYTVRDALPWVRRQGDNGGFGGGAMQDAGTHPSGAIGASPQTGNGRFPPSIVEAEADISHYAIGAEWTKLKPGEQSERFFSLVRPSLDAPSPCVTQRGGDGGVAAVTHPTECRKFTIAELRRICGFPDDFILTGTYAQQWERLGRAVPPVMMAQIAATVRDQILLPLRGAR